MEIKKIQIIKSKHGPDKIVLETNLPEPTYPFKGNLFAIVTAASGSGEEYVKKHFKLKPEVING